MQQRVRFSAKVAAGILSAWFLLLPLTANALGLGNIKMESALNQPLKAQIELLSATSSDIKGLTVKLASNNAFMRAGVDRTSTLTKIRFNVVNRNDKYYVELSTPEPVREPFLDFLVEMDWNNGRMLREYTVLLNPVSHQQEQEQAQAPETNPPASAPAPEAAAAPEPQPIPAPSSPFVQGSGTIATPTPAPQAPSAQAPNTEQASAPAPEPIAPASTPTPAATTPLPAPAPMPAAAATPQPTQPFEAKNQESGGLFPGIPLTAYHESKQTAPAPAPAGQQAAAPEPVPAAGELDYGITKKGDNLWTIAQKLKPDNSVTIYQVMMALQQANPKAFVHGNINRLKVGQVMRISDPSLLTAMSKAQALKQYQVQTREWESYLATVNTKNVPRQAIEAGEQTPTPAATGVPSGQLTLSSPESSKNTTGPGSNEATSNNSADAALLEKQARKAMESARKSRKKNAAMIARLNDLDVQLKHMQNLVTIKDSDLAALQRKLDELNAQRAVVQSNNTAQAEVTPVPSAPPAAEATPSPAAEATPAPTTPAPESTPALEATPVPTPVATPTPVPTLAQPSMPPVAKPSVPMSTPMPTQTSGGIMGMFKRFFGGVMGGMSTMMLMIGGVIIVVLLLLIFIMVRRRKGSSFQESILNVGNENATDSVSLDGPSQGSSLMGGESSFLSDFAISGVSAIQTEDSEVDPLTEADVFMAYGRYEAAEERLQEAITQDPERGELRVKLLELFNTTKDKKSFESAAEDFYATLGGNASSNPLWQKVVAMGQALVPNNPLFTGGVVPAAPAPSNERTDTIIPDLGEKQDVMDIGLDTGVFSTSEFNIDATSPPAQEEAAPSHTDSGLDFNLDLGQPSEPAPEAPADLDFSLDAATSSTPSEPETHDDLDFSLDMDSAGQETDTGGLDFNLDSGDEPTSETQAPPTRDDLDFNLNLEGDEEPTATEIKLDSDDHKAMSDLDFDFAQAAGSEEPAGTDMNLDASDASISLDAGMGDEVGTKLDLARAYIDMGDPDGARSILDEVLEEGNDGQKQEAQDLMAQIG